MTDESRQLLLDYFMGLAPNENGEEQEIFKEIKNLQRDDWEDGEILPDIWNDFKYEGIIQIKNSELLVLYGGYKTENNEVRGIITILNKDFKPLKSIFQYDSGTYLRYIQCMNQAEDNTFYVIDCPDFPDDQDWNFTTSQKRFLMFNNFTQQINNEYVLILQKSYIFPSNYFNFYCRKLYKDVNSSYYVMVGTYLRDKNDPDYDGIRVVSLKVNVGSENEWNKIDDDGTGWLMGDSYVEFKDDKYYLKILLNDTLQTSRELYLWTKDYTQNSPSLKSFKKFAFHPFVDSDHYKNQSVFMNKNELYFVQNNQRWGNAGVLGPKYIGLYYYNDETQEFKTIYEKKLGDYDFCNLEAIYITTNNNEIYIEFNNDIDTDNHFANYYFQRLVNNEWAPKLVSSASFVYYQRALFVTNEFNLLNIYAYPINPRLQTWYLCNIKEIYNESNYNGESFTNKESLNSHSAVLYSNESPVFARNLYNKTLNDNTTISTVEIPNTYLNDIDLTSKNLVSKTNTNIIEDTNVIRKNVYETVFINFINTVGIGERDINSPGQKYILNKDASILLNNSINNPVDYDQIKFTKARLNYSDGTSKIIRISVEKQIKDNYLAVISFYVDKNISNVEWISEDEKHVYYVSDVSSFEIGKTYLLDTLVRKGDDLNGLY